MRRSYLTDNIGKSYEVDLHTEKCQEGDGIFDTTKSVSKKLHLNLLGKELKI